MGLLSTVFYFFAPYTDARERAVGRFFKGLDEHSNQARTRNRLNELLQRDIAVINLWTEYRYKGYKYLRKTERQKLYGNLQRIADDFDQFYGRHRQTAETVITHIRSVAPQASPDPERIVLIQALVEYFSPERGIYEYHDTSSFGRLLRDPAHQTLTGDCNQIVTLYMYLYSRYYDVRDLQIRMLPEHVALHYAGVDIETTNGTFANYSHQKQNALLPAGEIVSINLLDTTDAYLSTHEVAAEDILQAARLAYILSHERDIVTRNLHIAYNKLAATYMRRHNYNQALKLAIASGDAPLLNTVSHNGAVYEIERHNYASARRFAHHARMHDDLVRSSWQAEGAHHYKAHRYHEAITAFKHSGDDAAVRQCYEALFFAEEQKLGSHLTTASIKSHAKVIKHMQLYAKKSGNKKLTTYARELSEYL